MGGVENQPRIAAVEAPAREIAHDGPVVDAVTYETLRRDDGRDARAGREHRALHAIGLRACEQFGCDRPVGAFAQTGVDQVGALLHRAGAAVFELYLPRSYAQSLCEWLSAAASLLR